MRKSIVAVLAVSTVFLVGCAEPSGPGDTDGTYEYVEVDTANGEEVGCVIWDGIKAGGIDCNWSE